MNVSSNSLQRVKELAKVLISTKVSQGLIHIEDIVIVAVGQCVAVVNVALQVGESQVDIVVVGP